MINIIENTLRDGSYVVDFQFSRKNTSDIVKGLSKLNFKFIEIGHGLGLGAYRRDKTGLTDEQYISAALKVSEKSKIGVFCIPGISTIEDLKIAIDLGVKFVRIGTNIDRFNSAKKFAEFAKNKGVFTCINLMKSYGVKSYEFTKVVKEIDSWELSDVIYLVDSAGCMSPIEIFEYIDKAKQFVKSEIGFHGHNNLSMAVANSLQAVRSGATYIDTCVRGMGRSAGNAQTEIVVHLLNEQNLLKESINIYDLYDFAENTVAPLMPRTQGLTVDEIHIGVSKFHTSFNSLADKASEKFGVDKRKLIKKVSDINCINPSNELFEEIAKKL